MTVHIYVTYGGLQDAKAQSSLTVIQFMYEYSGLFRNNHLSMLPDYVFSCGIIPNLIANVIQRNLYVIDVKLLDHVCGVSVPSDHLTLRFRIALSAAAVSTTISVDVVLLSGCLFL